MNLKIQLWEVLISERKNYTIIDRRGVEDPKPTCRVCGSRNEHSKEHNKPTMGCIRYLREEIAKLQKEKRVI
jgi:hypothetical protein